MSGARLGQAAEWLSRAGLTAELAGVLDQREYLTTLGQRLAQQPWEQPKYRALLLQEQRACPPTVAGEMPLTISIPD